MLYIGVLEIYWLFDMYMKLVILNRIIAMLYSLRSRIT